MKDKSKKSTYSTTFGIDPKKNGMQNIPLLNLGWITGLEPVTPGTTIQCSGQLSYIHHC